MDSFFDTTLIPFVMRGATCAVAYVRGGGEFAEDWHVVGQKKNKGDTWRDHIASVEALERMGYATPGRVAGLGVSADGIMIGRTVIERPDPLSAALMWAPMINMLRFETTKGGSANVAEFGSHDMTGVAKADGIAQAVDSYSCMLQHTGDPAFQPRRTPGN